jgi:hypothetical protein|tara:strand:+ start:837 stop:1304 length:468 start_codon:yes stop_codon:yes gene_type:complete
MTKATQSSRKTRASTTRKKTWTPPQKLQTQEAPEGMHYRWVRHELLNQPDDANVNSRIRQGYELVRPEELGDGEVPDILDTGKHAGTVRSGDLILMKVPQEIVDQRATYYKEQNRVMGQAYSNEFKQAGQGDMRSVDESSTTVSSGGARETKFED